MLTSPKGPAGAHRDLPRARRTETWWAGEVCRGAEWEKWYTVHDSHPLLVLKVKCPVV